MGVFAVTALLWLTDTLHGVPAPVVALLPAVAFTVTGIVGRAELDSLEWNVLLLIAGGLALGAGIQLTGLDRIVLAQVPAGLGSGPLLALLIAGGLLLGTFMSNTAVANLLLPLGFTAAQTAGTSPTGMAVSLALAASLSMALPISTPPNAIAYATGEVTARDMFRVGALLSLAGGALVLLLGEPLLRLAGVIRQTRTVKSGCAWPWRRFATCRIATSVRSWREEKRVWSFTGRVVLWVEGGAISTWLPSTLKEQLD